MNLYQTLRKTIERWPEHPVLIDQHGTLTCAELYAQTDALAPRLQKAGVRPGDGVAVMGRDSRGFIVAALAASACGAVVLPLSHQLPAHEIISLRQTAPFLLMLDDLTSETQIENTREHRINIAGSEWRMRLFENDTRRPLVPEHPDAAFIRFTSGTTGSSKGVILSHQGILDRTEAANRALELTRNDSILWVLPMAFHFFVSIILYLRQGATIILTGGNHLAQDLIEASCQHRATVIYASPLHYRMLAAAPRQLPQLPDSIRYAISTSTGLAPEIAQSFKERHNRPLNQAYGIIEVGLPIMNLENADAHPASVGRVLPDYETAFFEPGTHRMLTEDEGEIAVRGPGMFCGYLDPPSDLRSSLHDGWFLTGDLARRNPDQTISILGRCKSMINVGGQKVFPEEVESVLVQHPRVKCARVKARSHARLGEIVVAEVQPAEPSDPPHQEELIRYCRTELSPLKIPQDIQIVDNIPHTRSGKVLRS